MMLAGCATGPQPIPLSELQATRDVTQPAVTDLRIDNDAAFNVIPPETLPADLASGKVGAALALVADYSARDVEIEADVRFQGSGAPGIVFRAQRGDDGAVSSMYVVLVSSGGVSLWRLMDRQWQPLGRHAFFVAPEAPHRLRVLAVDAYINVFLDGTPVLKGFHTVLNEPGAAGIVMREGPCSVENLKIHGHEVQAVDEEATEESENAEAPTVADPE